jgi:hypothetical protein
MLCLAEERRDQMSNMTQNQRNQFERATLAGSAERIRHGSERGTRAYSVVAAIAAAVLCYGAVTLIDGWGQWVVLGVVVLTAVAVMIAVSPTRKT